MYLTVWSFQPLTPYTNTDEDFLVYKKSNLYHKTFLNIRWCCFTGVDLSRMSSTGTKLGYLDGGWRLVAKTFVSIVSPASIKCGR